MRGTAYQELKLRWPILNGQVPPAACWPCTLPQDPHSPTSCRPVRFRPEHQNKLGNEFLLYCGPEADAQPFGSWDAELDPSQAQQEAP